MQFKEWLLLNEIQHILMPKPTLVNGILTDGIDFRFEDWSKGYDQKSGVLKANPPNPMKYMAGSFSAPLDNGTYLNVMHSHGNAGFGGTALALQAQTEVDVSAEALGSPLPKQWFDFAIFYLGNKVVKPPEWPRSSYEYGQMGQVENLPINSK